MGFYRCGIEVKLWRAILDHRKQFTNSRIEGSTEILNTTSDDVINNIMRCPIISVSEITSAALSNANQNHENNVNRNSYDSNSNHATSSDDYESCNGSN